MNEYLLLSVFIVSVLLNSSLVLYGWRHRNLQGATAFTLAMFLFAMLPLTQAVNVIRL